MTRSYSSYKELYIGKYTGTISFVVASIPTWGLGETLESGNQEALHIHQFPSNNQETYRWSQRWGFKNKIKFRRFLPGVTPKYVKFDNEGIFSCGFPQDQWFPTLSCSSLCIPVASSEYELSNPTLSLSSSLWGRHQQDEENYRSE